MNGNIANQWIKPKESEDIPKNNAHLWLRNEKVQTTITSTTTKQNDKK